MVLRQKQFQFRLFCLMLIFALWLPRTLCAQQKPQVQNAFPTTTLRIVSSRNQPQHSTGKPLDKPLDYYYTDSDDTQMIPLNRNQFFQSFQPEIPICIFVHGSYVRPKDILPESALVKKWIRTAHPDKPIQIIYFTWSSDITILSSLPQIDINLLGHKAAFNGLYLSQLISQLPKDNPITLVGHSHGSRASVAALHLLGGGEVQGYQLKGACDDRHRIRTVLTAASVDHHWLNPNERYGKALGRAEHIVSLKNRDDWALALYPFRRAFSNSSIGRNGLTKKDYKALGKLKSKISEYDITSKIGRGHGWPHYAKRIDLARFLGDYMYYVNEKQQLANIPTPKRTSQQRTSQQRTSQQQTSQQQTSQPQSMQWSRQYRPRQSYPQQYYPQQYNPQQIPVPPHWRSDSHSNRRRLQ